MDLEGSMGNSGSGARSSLGGPPSTSTSKDGAGNTSPPSNPPSKVPSLGVFEYYFLNSRPAVRHQSPRKLKEPISPLSPHTKSRSSSTQLRHEQRQGSRLRYRCSDASASSTVRTHYPDKKSCQAAAHAKMTAAFVLDIGMVTTQREYVDSLHQGLDVAFQDFPLLNGSMKSHDEEEAQCIKHTTPGEGQRCGVESSSLAPIDWAEVRARLFSADKAPLWYRHMELGFGNSRDLSVYENAYQSLIVKEGFTHVIGCYAAGDGVVPVIDYVNARLSGESVQSLAQRMGFVGDAVDRPEHLKEKTHSIAYTRVNAFGNDPVTSCSCRQDKGHAQEVLKEAGLAYIRSCVTTRVEDALERIDDGTLLLPVVVKPNTGAGSEYVTLCYSVDDIHVAFSMVQGLCTSQGTYAGQLVVEEYIEGPEYVVNTVSYQGVHVVTDVWQSWKYPHSAVTTGLTPSAEEALRTTGAERPKLRKTSILYDKQTLITDLADLPVSHDARRVVEYTLKCLDALGLRNGCGHSELRLDSRRTERENRRQERQRLSKGGSHSRVDYGSSDDSEPILIELNSRMQGDIPRGTNVVGYDQYSLMVYIGEALNVFGGATAASTAFPFRINSSSAPPRVGEIPWPPVPRLYRSKSPACAARMTTVLFLATREECILNGLALRTLSELTTFQRFTRTLFKPNQPGFVTPLRHTIDLFSSPTACVMMGSKEEVESDCAVIRSMESAPLSSSTSRALLKLVSAMRETSSCREYVQRIDKQLRTEVEEYREVASRMGISADGVLEGKWENMEERDDHFLSSELKMLHASITSTHVELVVAAESRDNHEQYTQSLRRAFINELVTQRPLPLYISYSDFEKMRAAGVANELAVV